MNSGQVEFGQFSGNPVLRFCGDVRLTLCTTIDSTIDRLLEGSEPKAFWVDLSGAENIDSTCLGLLARLAIRLESEYGIRPALCGVNDDLTGLIDAMAMTDLFDWQGCAPEIRCASSDATQPSQNEVQAFVLSAHKDLMALCPENEVRFKDLVATLERTR